MRSDDGHSNGLEATTPLGWVVLDNLTLLQGAVPIHQDVGLHIGQEFLASLCLWVLSGVTSR